MLKLQGGCLGKITIQDQLKQRNTFSEVKPRLKKTNDSHKSPADPDKHLCALAACRPSR